MQKQISCESENVDIYMSKKQSIEREELQHASTLIDKK